MATKKWMWAVFLVIGCSYSLAYVPNSCAGYAAQTAESEEKPLDLKQTIEFAMEHSPRLDNARKGQTINLLTYRSNFARLLPSLDFMTQNGLQNNIPVGGYNVLQPNLSAPWYSYLNLSLKENLYDNGVTLTNLKISDIGRDIADIEFERARAGLVNDVANEFYNYSLMDKLFEIRQQQKQTIEKQYRILSGHYRQGLKIKLDFLRFKTQFQRAEIEQTNAERNREGSRTKLHQLMGLGFQNQSYPQTQKQKFPRFKPVEVDRKKRLDALMPNKPPEFSRTYDFRNTQLQKEINDRTVSLAVRKYWPQISVQANVNYSNVNYINGTSPFAAGHNLSWNTLITLQYNIWDWGILRRDVEMANVNRDIQNNTMTLTLLETQASINTLMIELARVKGTYKPTLDLLNNEEENFRNMEIQYRDGKMPYIDLINTLNSLLEARIQFLSTYFGALQSLARYRYYEGTIYESFFKE